MLASYGALWLAAFLSATLLPGSSEVVLLALLSADKAAPLGLVLVATFGNVAGALVNWGMGRAILTLQSRPWFPLKDATSPRAQAWFARYGKWSLLLSWVPVVGDALTLIAGILRVPILPFLLLVTVGKLARYLFILAVWQGWSAL